MKVSNTIAIIALIVFIIDLVRSAYLMYKFPLSYFIVALLFFLAQAYLWIWVTINIVKLNKKKR